MKIIERAKQFMPYSPLKGYDELLHERDAVKCEQIELFDERISEINSVLVVAKKNDIVEVVYYDENCYKKITGIVSNIDVVNKNIKVIKTLIKFEEIYSIEIKV